MENLFFLKGENSWYINDNEVSILERHFPNYKLSIINNAGHWLHSENYKDFYKESFTFLNK